MVGTQRSLLDATTPAVGRGGGRPWRLWQGPNTIDVPSHHSVSFGGKNYASLSFLLQFLPRKRSHKIFLFILR
jgi:hypothetical protein